MNKLFLLISQLFFCSFLLSQAISFTDSEKLWIQEHPVVEFGYEPKWEPYEIYDQGEYTGIVGEYVQRIEDATGIEMRPIPDISWKKSLEGLKSGSVKMVPSCAIDEERKKYLVFTKPYVSDPLVISTRREYEFVSCLQDLYGHTVALPEGYWTTSLIKNDHPKIKVIEKPSIQACLEAVSFEEADAYVGSLGVISYYVNHKGFTNLKIAAPTRYEDIKIAMAFNKDWIVFRDICQKVLNSISIQESSRIRQDWISVRYEYGFSWSKALTWMLIIGGIALAALLLFYLWNRSLKKQVAEKTKMQETLKVSLDQIKKQDREKKVLLQEIHHRVKNNLQIITSLIRLQASTAENEEIESSLTDATERIRAIALIHEKIYNTSELNYISAQEYISALANDIISSFSDSKKVDLEIDCETSELDLKAIVPLALILNELITNSLKYGFKGKSTGKITIYLKDNSTTLTLNYLDNGQWLDNPGSKNFGTSLISIFTDQLEGSYKLTKSVTGTQYDFEFKAYK